jgi:hypothetical protein
MQPTPSEVKLIDAAKLGAVADYSSGKSEENDPARGASWGPERTIRSEILKMLLLSEDPNWPTHRKGIQVSGAKIVGPLELQSGDTGSVAFRSCYFDDQIYLTDAKVGTLTLSGTRVVGVRADRLKAAGGVCLNAGFTSEMVVSFVGANIDDSLDLSGAKLKGRFGSALDLTNLRIRHDVSLNDGFHANGIVSLLGATISGDLLCANGTFEGGANYAIVATRASIAGTISFGQRFLVSGGLRLEWAKIGGNLACYDGTIQGHRDTGIAMSADGIAIDGSVFFGGLAANGEVRFVSADIKVDFECSGGAFVATKRNSALTLARATIGRALILEGMRATGVVLLSQARVGSLIDDSASWPSANCLELDGFVYDGLAREAPTGAKDRLVWLELQPSFHPQPYRQLARILREQGHDDDARTILIALADRRRRSGGLPWQSRIWAWILYLTMAYGYRPFRALWFIAAFVVAGYIVFGSAYRQGGIVPSERDAYKELKKGSLPGYYEPFCALTYSVDVFVPVIDLKQRNEWIPATTSDARIEPSDDANGVVASALCAATILPRGWSFVPGIVRLFRWIDIVAGWFFTSLFVAGVAGLVRSD